MKPMNILMHCNSDMGWSALSISNWQDRFLVEFIVLIARNDEKKKS